LFFFQFQEGVDECRCCGGCAAGFLTCIKPFAVTASGPVLRTFTGCARAVKGLRGPAQEAGSRQSRFHRVPTPDKVSFAANCNSETAWPDALPYKLIRRQASRIMASQKLQTCPAQQAVEKARLNIYAPIRLVTNRAARPLRRAGSERITLHIAKEGRLFKNFSS
jgi:hypothetical protein